MAGEIALKLNLQIKKETLATLQAAFVKLNEVVITPLQIHNANAADRNVGFSFCDAYCEVTELKDEQYKFGGLFINGIKILKDYLRKSPVLPKLPKDVEALERLLKCLEEGKEIGGKVSLAAKFKTTPLAVTLAEHLFSKLGLNPNYIIDKWFQEQLLSCPCGCKEDIAEKYSDTTIGHIDVWHGRLDVILGGGVHVEGDLVMSDSREGKSCVEVKRGEEDVGKLIAQTIVFSFLQQTRHPEYSNFLIPGVGACKSDMFFYFYDSKNDILLTSTLIPIVQYGELNPVAAIAAWMVVNYRTLSNGLTGPLLEITEANFFTVAKDKLEIYQKKLKAGLNDVSHKRKLEAHRGNIFTKPKYLKLLEDVLESDEDSS